MGRRDIPATALLARLPLFKDLDAAALARLATGAVHHRLERGDVLFRKGEPARGIYVVVHGDIKLVATTPARGSRLTGTVGPGQSFGEPVMFLERPALVDAQAASDALVLLVPKASVFAELDRNPQRHRALRRLPAAPGPWRAQPVVDLARRQGGGRVAVEPEPGTLLAHPARTGRGRPAAGPGSTDRRTGHPSTPARDDPALTCAGSDDPLGLTAEVKAIRCTFDDSLIANPFIDLLGDLP
jgi:hypothetical protein